MRLSVSEEELSEVVSVLRCTEKQKGCLSYWWKSCASVKEIGYYCSAGQR